MDSIQVSARGEIMHIPTHIISKIPALKTYYEKWNDKQKSMVVKL